MFVLVALNDVRYTYIVHFTNESKKGLENVERVCIYLIRSIKVDVSILPKLFDKTKITEYSKKLLIKFN